MAGDLVKNANSNWLIGRPFKKDLERVIGREVRIENDANCFALSEAVDGAGKDAEIVFGVILGTRGWRRNRLPPAGPGRRERDRRRVGPQPAAGTRAPAGLLLRPKGCIETFLSGPAFERDGKNLERYHDRLARALAGVINLLDPQVIVLGGGLSNLPSLYTEVPRIWVATFSRTPWRRASCAVYGDASGVRGAAWLWNEPTRGP